MIKLGLIGCVLAQSNSQCDYFTSLEEQQPTNWFNYCCTVVDHVSCLIKTRNGIEADRMLIQMVLKTFSTGDERRHCRTVNFQNCKPIQPPPVYVLQDDPAKRISRAKRNTRYVSLIELILRFLRRLFG